MPSCTFLQRGQKNISQRKELFGLELRRGRIFVRERLAAQIQELDRMIVAAQLTLHRRSFWQVVRAFEARGPH